MKPPTQEIPVSSALPNLQGDIASRKSNGRALLWEPTLRAIEALQIQLRGEIGDGAYGVVFEAVEPSGRKVAVKVMLDPTDEKSLAFFQREYRMLATDHDLLPHCYGLHDPQHGQPFIVLELIDGRHIHHYADHPRPMTCDERIALFEQFARDVDRLHESNIAHCDLSPNNVLVMAGGRIRFIDFGHSCRLNAGYQSLTSVSGPRGTPGFATDKLMEGDGRGDRHDDIHSAAAIGFYLLTGKTADKPRKPEKIEPHEWARRLADISALWSTQLRESRVPAAVRQIVLKGLRERDERKETDPDVYATAREMGDELACWREGRVRRRQWARQALVTCVLLAAMGALAWIGWSKYWAERHAYDLRRFNELNQQVSALPNANHPAVKRLRDQAAAHRDQQRQLLASGDSLAAATRVRDAIQSLDEAITASHRLQHAEPLLAAIGKTLIYTPWVTHAEVIQRKREALDAQHLAISQQVRDGELARALPALTKLQNDVAELAAQNTLAAQADTRRSEYLRLVGQIPETMNKLPGFSTIESFAAGSESAWAEGKWEQARDNYGQARQNLNEWLKTNAPPAVLASIQKATEELVKALERDKKQLESEIKELTTDTDGHLRQISELIKEKLHERDRADGLAKQLAESQTAEQALKNAARAKFQELGQSLATRQKQLDNLKQEKSDALAIGEQQLAAANLALESTRQDLAVWKAAAESGGNEAAAREAERAAALKRLVDAVDPQTRQDAQQALIEVGRAYREKESERTVNLREYAADSPTIQRIDAELARRKQLVDVALAKRDAADRLAYEGYERQIAVHQAEYDRLTKVEKMLPKAAKVQTVSAAIAGLRARQAPFQDGYARATGGGPSVDSLELIAQGSLADFLSKPGETAQNSIGMTLAFIPAGEFLMGSPDSEESRSSDEQQHRVRISYNFLMSVYELTQEQCHKITGRNPSRFSTGPEAGRRPLEQMTWFDAIEVANKLSSLEGLSPYYVISNIKRDDDGAITAATVKIAGGNGYRLPTEAEWEYAARAGATTPFPWGGSLNGERANIDGISPYGTSAKGPFLKQTAPVGSYESNAWGLYDMAGNVWEWCYDGYDSDFYGRTSDAAVDPVNHPEAEAPCVLRSGSWSNIARDARLANRGGSSPNYRFNFVVGIRFARTP